MSDPFAPSIGAFDAWRAAVVSVAVDVAALIVDDLAAIASGVKQKQRILFIAADFAKSTFTPAVDAKKSDVIVDLTVQFGQFCTQSVR